MTELLRVEHGVDLIRVDSSFVGLPRLLLSGELHLLLTCHLMLVRVLEMLLVGRTVGHLWLLCLHAVSLNAHVTLRMLTIGLAVATLHATSLLMAVIIVRSITVTLTLVLITIDHTTIHCSLNMATGLEVLSWTRVHVGWHRAYPALSIIANLQLVKEEAE